MPEHRIPATAPIPAAHAALSIGDIVRYSSLILEVIGLVKGAKGLAVGESEDVPPIKINLNGEKLTWANDKITRTA